MASNQKSPQQKRPKTTHNCFLACFGFHPKTNTSTNNNNSTYKKKASNNNKYGVIRNKFFFKLCLPKFKVLNIDSKNYKKKKKKKKEIGIKFDAKTGAFKASHNMMLEAATKVHQQFMIDHHHHHHAPKSSITTQEPMAILKDSPHQDNNQSRRRSKSQLNCTTCNNSQENGTPKGGMVKQSPMDNKVTKDSLIGVLIMVAMLIIMSIWGRLCAILCMCGLLYCIPLIRGGNTTQVEPSNTNDNDTTKDTKIMSVDFNSELYKKKVVLDGLLQRDHQDNAVGIS